MSKSMEEERKAVESGYWQLFRYNPTQEKPFTLDSKAPNFDFNDFLMGENRFAALMKSNPETAKVLFEQAKLEAEKKRDFYSKLSEIL